MRESRKDIHTIEATVNCNKISKNIYVEKSFEIKVSEKL